MYFLTFKVLLIHKTYECITIFSYSIVGFSYIENEFLVNPQAYNSLQILSDFKVYNYFLCLQINFPQVCTSLHKFCGYMASLDGVGHGWVKLWRGGQLHFGGVAMHFQVRFRQTQSQTRGRWPPAVPATPLQVNTEKYYISNCGEEVMQYETRKLLVL